LRGCSVVIADLALRPAAQKLVDAYASAQAGKPRAVFCRTDVTEWAQLERMFSTAVSEFGDVDIVCPGAGIFEPRWGDFWNPPGAEGTRDSIHGDRFMTVDINIVHPIRTTQLAIQQFLNLGEGREKVGVRNQKRIIIVSSITGQIHTLLTPVYVASKHAM
jgi:NAD(P)-dependent dehydrogenase (short-subunit alcohol dehydrogenase family)